jgi:hypothetical protein
MGPVPPSWRRGRDEGAPRREGSRQLDLDIALSVVWGRSRDP